MTWKGRRALVTGASGFIGGHLAARLAALEADVHAVSRRAQAAGAVSRRAHAAGGGDGGTVHWHQADLRDQQATAELLAEVSPDVVFHLASEVNGARDPEMVPVTLAGNLQTTVNLLTAAVRHECRMVLAGSIEEPRPGNGHAAAPSPYAMAKSAASGYADLYRQLWGLPCTILRPSMVYGPAQPDTTKLVPYVTLALLRGEEPRLTSGAKVADWVYVDDVVAAFVSAAVDDRAIGQSFDVGTGVKTSVRELVELLYGIAGAAARPSFGAVADRPLDIPQVADVGPAFDLIGWRPTVELTDGLRRTVAWYARKAA
ncbi:NAD-dependent epimerase/dehydratase family protein [Nonomuraea sp. SYSU D8015]|uniref:NAD-dependent epimerase/dehydratase family protein n=1 Tax=Nonomuraea sp. SYSU D8015 TaxID=2593644 RepID=UPI0016611235|nr:NAD-dependent epimerase/dehydratase family protein [Nonomuraea sp. SYSU D8015]